MSVLQDLSAELSLINPFLLLQGIVGSMPW